MPCCRGVAELCLFPSLPALPVESIRKGQSCTALCVFVCQPRLWQDRATDGSRAGLWPGEGALAAGSSTTSVAAPLPAKPLGEQTLHLFAAVSKLPACPQPVAQRGHQMQLPAAQSHWARKQRDGLMACRKPYKSSSNGMQGHGNWEQKAVHSYRNCPRGAFLY